VNHKSFIKVTCDRGLQCVAVCCNVLQCVAVHCKCVVLCCSVLQPHLGLSVDFTCVAICCSVLQVCCTVLQSVAAVAATLGILCRFHMQTLVHGVGTV